MDYWVETALRPIRHYADFRGRATRSELVAFYVLTSVVTAGVAYVTGMFLPLMGDGPWRTGQAAVQIFLFCPTMALFVRRLHDQGKSGLWLLLLLPALGANLWQFYAAGFSTDPFKQLEHPIPGIVIAVGALPLLILMILLLWKDELATNRYGPNPRYDATVGPEAEPEADQLL